MKDTTRQARDEAAAMFKMYELPFLKVLEKLLAKEIEMRQSTVIQDAILNVQKIAASVGLSVEDLLQVKPRKLKDDAAPKKAKKAKAPNPPMYRHPSDESLTWTGYGPAPKWLTSLIVKGKTRNDFLIKPN